MEKTKINIACDKLKALKESFDNLYDFWSENGDIVDYAYEEVEQFPFEHSFDEMSFNVGIWVDDMIKALQNRKED